MEQRIAGKNHLFFRKIIAGTTDGMTRCMKHMNLKSGKPQDFTILQEMIRMHGVTFSLKPTNINLRNFQDLLFFCHPIESRNLIRYQLI